jgi:FKBP-type peptidyl-prolyl cis-trans isomerase
LFDSSKLTQADSTWEFELGNPAMIPGWDDGMKVINKGAQVQLIIQSKLAYGIYGSGEIPPNNTLLFVVDMVNIEPS